MNVEVQAVGDGAHAEKAVSGAEQRHQPANRGPRMAGDAAETGERFQVAMSFADEDRSFVREVVDAPRADSVRVFYDADLEVELWGRDLAQYLDSVYRSRSDFVVVFIFRDYVAKKWTRHEFRSALAGAIMAKREYVLPARFDETEVPGLPPTARHVDLRLHDAGPVRRNDQAQACLDRINHVGLR